MRKALLDGDVLIYQAGFASDATAKRAWVDDGNDPEEFDIKEHHEPWQYQRFLVKQMIQRLLDATNSTTYAVAISHPVNHRERMFPDYKMNRDVTHKPFWHKEIKEYLLDEHGAVFSMAGDEADDLLGQWQMMALADDEETVICSIDKDLDLIPGLHYNFSKTRAENGVYDMEDPECFRLFYKQIITGDSTDNIPGIFKKRGIKASKKFLEPLDEMTRVGEMYGYVLGLFEDDKAHVDLMGKLLWIKRDNNWWEPPY